MVSMRSIGLASSRSCRTAHLQNEATAARLRLRVAGACPAISPRNARTGTAVSAAISPSWWAAKAIRSPRYARIVFRGLFAFARSVRKSSMWRASGCPGSTSRAACPGRMPVVAR